MSNYAKACVEVEAVLNSLTEEDYIKIPQKILKKIHQEKDTSYKFEFDSNIDLREQNLMEESRAILFNIFRDYLCTEEQRQKIKKWQNEDRMNAKKERMRNLSKTYRNEEGIDFTEIISKKKTTHNE